MYYQTFLKISVILNTAIVRGCSYPYLRITAFSILLIILITSLSLYLLYHIFNRLSSIIFIIFLIFFKFLNGFIKHSIKVIIVKSHFHFEYLSFSFCIYYTRFTGKFQLTKYTNFRVWNCWRYTNYKIRVRGDGEGRGEIFVQNAQKQNGGGLLHPLGITNRLLYLLGLPHTLG